MNVWPNSLQLLGVIETIGRTIYVTEFVAERVFLSEVNGVIIFWNSITRRGFPLLQVFFWFILPTSIHLVLLLWWVSALCLVSIVRTVLLVQVLECHLKAVCPTWSQSAADSVINYFYEKPAKLLFIKQAAAPQRIVLRLLGESLCHYHALLIISNFDVCLEDFRVGRVTA